MSKGFTWTLVGLGIIGVTLSLALLPLWSTSSNCGGNSAALSAVNSYITMAVVAAMDSADGRFDVKSATAEQRHRIADLPGANWVRSARFLVSTAPFFPRSQESRRVVIVCDKPYTNVPQRRFFESPPTHAAGFSDGTTGLISPQEFAALDQPAFMAIDQLFPKEKNPPAQ